jgi:hypothetical protein
VWWLTEFHSGPSLGAGTAAINQRCQLQRPNVLRADFDNRTHSSAPAERTRTRASVTKMPRAILLGSSLLQKEEQQGE